MSTIHRRNSQRLASALDALTSDLNITASEIEASENITAISPEEYLAQDERGYGANDYSAAVAFLGEEDEGDKKELPPPEDDDQQFDPEDDEELPPPEDDDQEEDDFQAAFKQAMMESDENGGKAEGNKRQSQIQQGDPGVSDFGSEETYDTQNVRDLGSSYGVDFDGDDRLQDTIRNVPGRSQKQAKIKKLIARIERVADHLENTGRKKLAYRLDIVCNNLQKKYSIK